MYCCLSLWCCRLNNERQKVGRQHHFSIQIKDDGFGQMSKTENVCARALPATYGDTLPAFGVVPHKGHVLLCFTHCSWSLLDTM